MASGNRIGKTLGQPIRRLDGVAKVTGQALYSGDFHLPGMLFGRCLRSPYACARIVSVDVRGAAALPGVHAVLTGADVPDVRYGRASRDIPILPRDRVLFVGDRVAAVAAETEEIADAALALIEVKYEELPALFSAEEAMAGTAIRLHPEAVEVVPSALLDHVGELHMYPGAPNVIVRHTAGKGDTEKAFSEADHIFEHRFSIPSVHQGYIEPNTCIVSIGEDGVVDVWASTKAPFPARGLLSQTVGVAPNRIRFNTVMIGGDFGAKGMAKDTILCYFLANRARRPVKMTMTYLEELTAGNPRHSATIDLRSAFDGQFKILAMQARMVFDSGAYAGFCPLPTMAGYRSFAGSYRVPNCAIELLRVYTNTVPAGHMRSPGCPQINFAVESHLDIIAHELGVDPLELRHRNAIAEGDLSPLGEHRRSLRCVETIDAGARAFGWHEPKESNIGRGMGLYEFPPGNFGPSNVTLTLQTSGRAVLVVGTPENGAGFHTIAAQLVADHLGIAFADVELVYADTLSSQFELGASGSRLTTVINQAIGDAASKVKAQLNTLAAERLNCAPSEVQIGEDGSYAAQGATIGRSALLDWAAQRGKAPIVCHGVNMPNKPDDLTNFAAQFAEVAVDPETGRVDVRRVVTAHDVGAIINPTTHQGQIDGAVVQAFGQATMEHLKITEGVVMTPHLGEYKLPTMMDIPELETVLVPKGGTALSDATAIGEMGNVALCAAISNAVYDAVGVRFYDLPVSAEKIFTELKKRSAPA